MLMLASLFNIISFGGLILGFMTCSLFLVTSASSSTILIVDFFMGSMGQVSFNFPLVLDQMSGGFLATVCVISAAVILFSRSYMGEELFFIRFHVLVWLFILSMAALILSPNMVSLLLGWDGLGVTSYLLVIYFNNSKAFGAGMLTALSNRVGDVIILLIIATISFSGSWNFFFWSHNSSPLLTSVMVLLILAASTKSAQVPFSAWLPAAMAAPTPVSSLVHSSTLVTAGVYLLIRFNEILLENSLLALMLFVGTITMLMAGVSALFETDLKKIVALSTLSQLGLMVAALGLAAPEIAFFHLTAHAFFKALLFMSVGSMIHMSSDYQDLRKISMGAFSGPTFAASMVANLSLCGLPFMAGFYSKDLILEMGAFYSLNVLIFLLFYVATLLTAFYSARFMAAALVAMKNSHPSLYGGDSDLSMPLAFSLLLPMSIFSGSLISWALFSAPPLPIIPPSSLLLIIGVVSTGLILGMLSNKVSYFCPRPTLWSWGNLWTLPGSSLTLNIPALLSSSSIRFFDMTWVVGAASSPKLSATNLSLKDNTNVASATQMLVFFSFLLLFSSTII